MHINFYVCDHHLSVIILLLYFYVLMCLFWCVHVWKYYVYSELASDRQDTHFLCGLARPR